MITLCDTYENYIGGIIKGKRAQLELNAVDVYLGIYIAKAEYDELMDRLDILEDIREGRLDSAKERIGRYDIVYSKNPLNSQFVAFMRGRLAELKGNDTEALEYYENAINKTMRGYEKRERISCMTIHEAYMMFGVARMKRRLGNGAEAYKLYMLLLRYCMSSNVEKWNLVCIYPKVICEMSEAIGTDNTDDDKIEELLWHCENALDMLVGTSRLHYIRPLLKNIIRFKLRLGIEIITMRICMGTRDATRNQTRLPTSASKLR